jgi:hypothetical protein
MIQHLFTADPSFDLAPTPRGGGNYKPPRRMSGGNINQKPKKMQNKPNLCGFQAKNSYYEKKQTQSNPIQSQFKPIFRTKNHPQTQNKPNQTQFPPQIGFTL